MLDLKLMIVEDEETIRTRLVSILKREVREVRGFDRPSAALEALNAFVPDAILTDIKMPGMSGLEMAKIIRADHPDIPLIIASAFSEPELFINAIHLKVENFVVKPVDMDELLRTLGQIAEQLDTRRELAETSSVLNQYKHIVDHSTNISITDPDGVITYVNDNFCELCGYSREELVGQPHSIVRHPDMSTEFFREMWHTIRQKQVWQGIIKNRRKDGTVFYVNTTIAPMLDTRGDITEYVSIKNDITDVITSKQQLQHDIVTDRLTGLRNRISLQEQLKNPGAHALLLIDIDRFKEINLLFGIHFGDAVLRYVATILSHHCREGLVYRIASDEFCLLVPAEHADKLNAMAQTLHEAMEAEPFELDGVGFDVDFTAAVMTDSTSCETPIEQLQSTMAEAKQARKPLIVFDPQRHQTREYEANFVWTRKLKSALAESRIEVHYQPIYDLAADKITKYESLVRLRDEAGELVMPGAFLAAAKRSKHYQELTHTIVEQACATFESRSETFSVNVSIEDLTDERTIEFLIDQVRRRNLQDRIVVEVLESEGIDNFDVIRTVFARLRDAGIRIAIDDFGSGDSNFAYLVNLPVSLLKIDGSLIRNLPDDNSARVIVQSIVLFAHELGFRCVAEFVSNARIFEIVKALGVDFAQGYYVGKPEAAIRTEAEFEAAP